MASKMTPTGVGDWQPPTPNPSTDTYAKLLGTEAHDNPDALNGTNVLKNFVGKAMGTPNDATLGPRGRNF